MDRSSFVESRGVASPTVKVTLCLRPGLTGSQDLRKDLHFSMIHLFSSVFCVTQYWLVVSNAI